MLNRSKCCGRRPNCRSRISNGDRSFCIRVQMFRETKTQMDNLRSVFCACLASKISFLNAFVYWNCVNVYFPVSHRPKFSHRIFIGTSPKIWWLQMWTRELPSRLGWILSTLKDQGRPASVLDLRFWSFTHFTPYSAENEIENCKIWTYFFRSHRFSYSDRFW